MLVKMYTFQIFRKWLVQPFVHIMSNLINQTQSNLRGMMSTNYKMTIVPMSQDICQTAVTNAVSFSFFLSLRIRQYNAKKCTFQLLVLFMNYIHEFTYRIYSQICL